MSDLRFQVQARENWRASHLHQAESMALPPSITEAQCFCPFNLVMFTFLFTFDRVAQDFVKKILTNSTTSGAHIIVEAV